MHDYVASWFERYLRNVLSSLYNYCCISAIERKRGQMFKNIDKKNCQLWMKKIIVGIVIIYLLAAGIKLPWMAKLFMNIFRPVQKLDY
jgi:hypothetical protein